MKSYIFKQNMISFLSVLITGFFIAGFPVNLYAEEDKWLVIDEISPQTSPLSTRLDKTIYKSFSYSIITDQVWERIYLGYDSKGALHHDAGNMLGVENYLYLGTQEGSEGIYNLNGGSLYMYGEVYNATIGDKGTGIFRHNSGDFFYGSTLWMGNQAGSRGEYNLSSGKLYGNSNIYVGNYGVGIFNQTGGTISVGDPGAGSLYVGSGVSGEGVYNLLDGELDVDHTTCVGHSGNGLFIQTGGIHSATRVTLAGNSGSQGQYDLSGGEIISRATTVGKGGIGIFNQSGGMHSVTTNLPLYLGEEAGSHGTYNLSNGSLSVNHSLTVGHQGDGVFTQTGGTSTMYTLNIGQGVDSEGRYNLSGGNITTDSRIYLGGEGSGVFSQSGGISSAEELRIGFHAGSEGTYSISGGRLEVNDVIVGYDGKGTFNIEDANAYIEIKSKLKIGEQGIFNAVEGSTIHMTGSTFENESTNPESLSGLKNLTLIFEGGEVLDTFEVCGKNFGPTMEGFNNNFSLDTLILGGENKGKVQFVDNFDNHPDWEEMETLYVKNFTLNQDSYLDLNGVDLYYLNFTNNGGTIDFSNGGNIHVTPEPISSTLFLLGSAVFGLFGYKKRKCKA